MKKVICLLATVLFGILTMGSAPAGASNCQVPFDQNGKAAVVIHEGGCTLEVKASTDLHNACGEFFLLGISNAVSLEQIGFLVFGDEGSCSVATEVDAAGNAVAKAECQNGGHTKISLTVSSCFLDGA